MDVARLLLNPAEINNICRGCLGRRGEMRPLYAACLDDMLMAVTTVRVKDGDGLPYLMCVQCILQLSKAYSFKQLCEKSDAILKMFLNTGIQDQLNGSNKCLNNDDEIDSKASVDCSLLCENDNPDDFAELVEFKHDIPMTEEPLIDPVDEIPNDIEIDTYGIKLEFDSKSDMPSAKYFCTKCDETFHLKVDHKLHLQLVHPVDNTCGTCEKTFTERRSLKRHMKTHLETKPHECEICHKSFADMSNLKKHKKKHTGELRNVEGKPHLCSVCGRSFKWASSLSKHSKYHTGRKLLCCKYCPKQYVEARSLRIHMRSHTGETPYVCSICNKGFTQQCNLEKHIRVHTGEKPHSCDVCGKGFSQRSYVTIHMRVHTGEKPYVCGTCGKSFSGTNTLSAHKRIHSGKKLYDCSTCGKNFMRPETLVVHQRSHTGEKPYICTICSKGFSSTSHLLGHMRCHSGVKPHLCTVCNKRFATSGSLKLHMKSHNREKLHICDYCGKEFTLNSSLIMHLLSHTIELEKRALDQENAANIEIVNPADCLPQWEIDMKGAAMEPQVNDSVDPAAGLVTEWTLQSTGQIFASTTTLTARTVPITQWTISAKPVPQTNNADFTNHTNVKF